MSETLVRVEKPRAHVSLITLNKPERLNSMSFGLVGALYEALEEVGGDNDTWVAVLTGAGRGFCSGLDLDDMGSAPGLEGITRHRAGTRAMAYMGNVVPAMRAIPQPLIAAINGPAYGGGMCLTLGCDIRIAAESAVLVTGYARIALTGDYGISWLLTRLAGTARARELMYFSERVDARRGEQIGLINRVVPDAELRATAFELAKTLAQGPSAALAAIKDNLDKAVTSDFLTSLDHEAENMVKAAGTAEHKEAVRAFVEKRAPKFSEFATRA